MEYELGNKLDVVIRQMVETNELLRIIIRKQYPDEFKTLYPEEAKT